MRQRPIRGGKPRLWLSQSGCGCPAARPPNHPRFILQPSFSTTLFISTPSTSSPWTRSPTGSKVGWGVHGQETRCHHEECHTKQREGWAVIPPAKRDRTAKRRDPASFRDATKPRSPPYTHTERPSTTFVARTSGHIPPDMTRCALFLFDSSSLFIPSPPPPPRSGPLPLFFLRGGPGPRQENMVKETNLATPHTLRSERSKGMDRSTDHGVRRFRQKHR